MGIWRQANAGKPTEIFPALAFLKKPGSSSSASSSAQSLHRSSDNNPKCCRGAGVWEEQVDRHTIIIVLPPLHLRKKTIIGNSSCRFSQKVAGWNLWHLQCHSLPVKDYQISGVLFLWLVFFCLGFGISCSDVCWALGVTGKSLFPAEPDLPAPSTPALLQTHQKS